MLYAYVMTIEEIFSKNFAQLRERAGITQAKVAEACGVSVQHVKDLEAGRKKPSVDLIFAIASCLKVPSADLIEQPESEKPEPIVQPSKILAMYGNIPDSVVIKLSKFPAKHEIWEWIEAHAENHTGKDKEKSKKKDKDKPSLPS